jgi:uridylate kinase
MLLKVALDIKNAQRGGVEIAVVIGGGNVCRGNRETVQPKRRASTDKIGMLITIINGLVLSEALNVVGVKSVVLSTRSMPAVCELYTVTKAKQFLELGNVVICVGGSGQPFFTTDTAAVVRACELDCNVLMKATKVDGIYDCDPEKNQDAKYIARITYSDFMQKNVKIMDLMAISLAKEENLPIEIFCIYEKDAICSAIDGIVRKSLITAYDVSTNGCQTQ